MVAMMPLGLTDAQLLTYVAFLFRTHDFAISVDVLNVDHTPVRSLVDPTAQLVDGQVNVQNDSPVTRTATFTFADPDHSLHLDADSPWQGATYADRMLQVRHTVTVPGLGKVEAIPFVGPITKVSRDGDVLSVECQDKACLALTGTTPVTVKKGMDAVDAIRKIMRDGAGENRFRLPNGIRRNLHKSFSTGWHDDAAPWIVASRIAGQLNRQLLYSSDGYLTLRALPSLAQASVTVTGAAMTSPPQVDFDATAIRNMVRVSGTQAPPRAKKRKPDAKPQLERPAVKLNAVAVAAPNHPLSPQRLGRNGVPRFLPVVIEGAVYKSLAQARDLATTTLARDLGLTTGVSFDMVPVFHLDVGDVIEAKAPAGRVVVRFTEGSIPLGVSGDMSVGTQRNVSTGRGVRVHTSRRRPAPSKKARKAYRHDLASWRKGHHRG